MSEVLPAQWMGYGTASSWVFTIIVSSTTPPFFRSIKEFTYLLYMFFMLLVLAYPITPAVDRLLLALREGNQGQDEERDHGRVFVGLAGGAGRHAQ